MLIYLCRQNIYDEGDSDSDSDSQGSEEEEIEQTVYQQLLEQQDFISQPIHRLIETMSSFKNIEHIDYSNSIIDYSNRDLFKGCFQSLSDLISIQNNLLVFNFECIFLNLTPQLLLIFQERKTYYKEIKPICQALQTCKNLQKLQLRSRFFPIEKALMVIAKLLQKNKSIEDFDFEHQYMFRYNFEQKTFISLNAFKKALRNFLLSMQNSKIKKLRLVFPQLNLFNNLTIRNMFHSFKQMPNLKMLTLEVQHNENNYFYNIRYHVNTSVIKLIPQNFVNKDIDIIINGLVQYEWEGMQQEQGGLFGDDFSSYSDDSAS